LKKKLHAREIHEGFNFRFGHKAEGNVQLLTELGREFGFDVIVYPEMRIRREPVSSSRLRELIAFYLLFAAVAGLAFWLVHSYLDIIAFSLTAVIILKPLYDRVLTWVGGRAGLAATLTLCAFFLAVIVPLAIALSIVAGQAASILAAVRPGTDLLSTEQIDKVMAFITSLNLPFSDQIETWLLGAASQAASVLAQFALGLGASIPDLISRLFIFLGIVGTLLPNYHPFVQRLMRLSPLDDQVDSIFLHRIKLTVRSMFLGIFVIAVAQGLVTGLLFWIAGVPYSLLLTLVAVVSSMFPLGASLVAFPLGGVELLIGRGFSYSATAR
jgi:predicted PurR-regulated permease PerM